MTNLENVKQQRKVVEFTVSLLKRNEKRKVFIYGILLFLITGLDTLSLILFGVLVLYISESGSSSTEGIKLPVDILEILNIDLNDRSMFVILCFVVGFLLTIRTVLFTLTVRNFYMQLANFSERISQSIFHRIIDSDLDILKSLTTEKINYALIHGGQNVIIGILGQLTIFAVEASYILCVVAVLLLINPINTFTLIVIFGFFALVVEKVVSKKIEYLSKISAESQILGSELVTNAVDLNKELKVSSVTDKFHLSFSANRKKATVAFASNIWYQSIPRYLLEIVMVVAFFSMFFLVSFDSENSIAIPELSIFVASITRMAPSALRIQQITISLKSYIGMGLALQEVTSKISENDIEPLSNRIYLSEPPSITAKNAEIKFDDGELCLKNLNFHLPAGTITAIIGPSGGGKSTLVEALIGLRKISKGRISLNERVLHSYTDYERDTFGILTQSPKILLEELTGDVSQTKHNNMVFRDLDGIADFASIYIDLNADKSGGEIQKISLLRIISQFPKVLVLDEPTSALDPFSEHQLLEFVRNNQNRFTTVIVAHRLSTLQYANQVIFVGNKSAKLLPKKTDFDMLMREYEAAHSEKERKI